MTLIFAKRGTAPDNRMIEYDQAIVRLGLEKAKLESECDQKKREIRQLCVARDLIAASIIDDRMKLTGEKQKEINEKSSALALYEEKIAWAKKILDAAILGAKEADQKIDQRLKEIEVAASELNRLEHKTKFATEQLVLANNTREQKDLEAQKSAAAAAKLGRDKDAVAAEVYQLSAIKSAAESELELRRRELGELNEIISVLRASNKNGLELISSFEGERKRLKEKEDLLARKEADLSIYEKRLEKAAKIVGVDIKMVFK